MKKLYKGVVGISALIVATILISNHVYNYGASIGYEITATTVSGKTSFTRRVVTS